MIENDILRFPKDRAAPVRKRRSRARQKPRKQHSTFGLAEYASLATANEAAGRADAGHSPDRSDGIRNAAKAASDTATLPVPAERYLSRMLVPTPAGLPHGSVSADVAPRQHLVRGDAAVPSSSAPSTWWSTIGRMLIGTAIISAGAFIASTSMRANAWFGHSLTPDTVAGEVYSHLSVAAEVIACLLPTAVRFYWQSREWWTALQGWALMAVPLVVVFFAAGGFAVTNLNAGVDARAERSTAEIVLAQRRLDTVTKSRAAECAKRGPLCRKLEAEEQAAIASLEQAHVDVRAEADPQAAALGISSVRLHAIQAGSMVLLCLFSGLFISFGAGLIWRKPAPSQPQAR